MEEEPNKGGAHPSFREQRPDHGGSHDDLQRRAAPRVERRRELTGRRRSEQEHGNQAMPRPERRHGQTSQLNLYSYV